VKKVVNSRLVKPGTLMETPPAHAARATRRRAIAGHAFILSNTDQLLNKERMSEWKR